MKTAKAAPQPAHRQSLLPTDQSPYYRIWVVTNLASRPFTGRFGSRFDLNVTEWRVLLTIADKPNVTAQALADYTGLDKMSVSRIVRKLEAQGRVERSVSQTDRRSFHLNLSDAGWMVYTEIAQGASQRESDIYAGLNPAEIQTLNALLGKLLARARLAPADPGAEG